MKEVYSKFFNNINISKSRIILYFAIFIFSILMVSVPKKASAAFDASTILPDTVFLNSGSMTQQQIQDFLSYHSSYLATYNIPSTVTGPNGETYDAGVSAATIVYRAGRAYGVNPQVILATLQKEESLITLSNPEQWRIDSAMGYACPDSGGCDSRYAGYAKQVLFGAWQLRFNFERSDGSNNFDPDIHYYGFHVGDTLPGTSIVMQSRVAASLYSYTPHNTYGGAFYTCYMNWFGLNDAIKAADNLRTDNTQTIAGTDQANYYFNLRNTSNDSIVLQAVQVATYNPYLPIQSAIFNQTNITLGALYSGDENLYIAQPYIFPSPGYYKVWIAYEIDGVWYSPQTVFAGQVTYFTVYSRMPNLTVSSSALVYPSNPVIGQDANGRFSITNNENRPISVDKIVLATWYNYPQANVDNYTVVDVPLSTIDPGQTIDYDQHRVFSQNGYHRSWAAVSIAGRWYDLASNSGKAANTFFYTRTPNITVSSPLIIYPSNPSVGEIVTSKYKVTNNESFSVQVDQLLVAAWYNYPQANVENFDSYIVPSSTLAPGESTEITASRIFTHLGYYRTWIAMCVNSRWYDLPASPRSTASTFFYAKN